MGFHRATKSKPSATVTERISDMTTAAVNSFSARSATMLRDMRRAMRMQMQSTIDDRVQSRAHNVLRELNEAEARIMAHEEAATKARALWREICGELLIENMEPPNGASMLVWLMSLVVGADARSKADRTTALYFKAGCAALTTKLDEAGRA